MIPFANESEQERSKTSYKVEQLANKLGISVPIRFSKDPKLISPLSTAVFFTTNTKYPKSQAIQQQIFSSLRHASSFDSNPYFLAFGQSEIDSTTFDIFYSNEKLRYIFSAHVGSVSDSQKEQTETKSQINGAFKFLNQVLAKNNLAGDNIYLINDNGDKDTVFCRKMNTKTNEWSETTTSKRSEFI